MTQQELVVGFRRLGVQDGDDVLMHSSLRSFGWVDGGADAVIDALLEVVGEDGTLLVPTLIFRGSMWEFVQTDPVYDVRQTPSRSGLITETLRRRPEARRSLHPTSPVAAIGARAAYYTQSHHLEPMTVGGASSPWALLRKAPRGMILLAGVGFSRCSLLHGVEDDLEPAYHFAPGLRLMTVIDADGERRPVNLRVYNKVPDRDFAKVDRLFQNDPAISHGKVGESDCVLGTAAHIYDRTAALVRTDPDWFRRPWAEP